MTDVLVESKWLTRSSSVIVELKCEDISGLVGWIDVRLVKESSCVCVAFTCETKLGDNEGVMVSLLFQLIKVSRTEVFSKGRRLVMAAFSGTLKEVDIAGGMVCFEDELVNKWISLVLVSCFIKLFGLGIDDGRCCLDAELAGESLCVIKARSSSVELKRETTDDSTSGLEDENDSNPATLVMALSCMGEL